MLNIIPPCFPGTKQYSAQSQTGWTLPAGIIASPAVKS
jgi:hypothetical protein